MRGGTLGRTVSRKTDREQVERVKQALAPFIAPIERLRKNPRRALSSPQSTLHRLKRDVEQWVQQLPEGGAEAFMRSMFDLLPEELDADLPARFREDLVERRASFVEEWEPAAQLLSLFDEANARGPIGPMLLFAVDPQADRHDVVDEWSVLGALKDARRLRGERRADRLLRAIPALVGSVYARFLRILWAFSHMAEGHWPSRPPSKLGALVDQLASRLARFPGLVDRNAARLRNAVAHESARYHPSARAVRFVEQRDPLVPSPNDWMATLTLPALEARLQEMWFVGGPMLSKLADLASREAQLATGLVEALPLIRRALREDAEATKQLEAKNLDAAYMKQLIRKPPAAGE